MTSHVTFTRTTSGMEVRFHYDPDTVDLLKTVVPASARSWDPRRKVWTITSTHHARNLAAALRSAGITVVGLDEEPQTRPKPTGSWASAMFAALPERLHDPVYRALSRVLHPDIGGDTRATQQLNDARPAKRRAS